VTRKKGRDRRPVTRPRSHTQEEGKRRPDHERDIGRNTRLASDEAAAHVIAVVDTDRKELQWYESFPGALQASAYQDGITDAWDHSRGSLCAYRALNLDHPSGREDWTRRMGSPGAELFAHAFVPAGTEGCNPLPFQGRIRP
jgi:hypothetical protein